MEHAYEGGCVCGAVRYRARGEPTLTMACHCTFCQRRLGSAFGAVAFFKDEDVEFKGQLSEYVHRSDESGRLIHVRFCPRCGTSVSHLTEIRPGMRAVSIGTLDDPKSLPIQRHIWTRSKWPWVAIPADAAVFEKGSVAVPPVKEMPR